MTYLVQRRGSIHLGARDLGQNRVLAESRATHKVENLLPIHGAEPRGAIGHNAPPLRGPNLRAQVGLGRLRGVVGLQMSLLTDMVQADLCFIIEKHSGHILTNAVIVRPFILCAMGACSITTQPYELAVFVSIRYVFYAHLAEDAIRFHALRRVARDDIVTGLHARHALAHRLLAAVIHQTTY